MNTLVTCTHKVIKVADFVILKAGTSVEDGTEGTNAPEDSDSTMEGERADDGVLLTLDEYYENTGIVPGPWMDGHYKGWVRFHTPPNPCL